MVAGPFYEVRLEKVCNFQFRRYKLAIDIHRNYVFPSCD